MIVQKDSSLLLPYPSVTKSVPIKSVLTTELVKDVTNSVKNVTKMLITVAHVNIIPTESTHQLVIVWTDIGLTVPLYVEPVHANVLLVLVMKDVLLVSQVALAHQLVNVHLINMNKLANVTIVPTNVMNVSMMLTTVLNVPKKEKKMLLIVTVQLVNSKSTKSVKIVDTDVNSVPPTKITVTDVLISEWKNHIVIAHQVISI